MQISRDAERIMGLPFAHHPSFAGRCEELARDPAMTFEGAIDALCREMEAKGVSELDLEMCQPGTAVKLPFVAAANTDPGSTFDENVAGHVRRMLAEGRR